MAGGAEAFSCAKDGSDQRSAQRDRRVAPTSYLPLGPSLDPFSFPRQ